MSFVDDIQVQDVVRVKSGRRVLDFGSEKSVVEVTGWVKTVCRERGKIVPGSHREGHNTWTNTGREYLAMLMSIQMAGNPAVPYRDDRIAYIGVGVGSQPEDPGVTNLVQPIAFAPGQFLASIDVAATTFPLLPTRTTVRFSRTFSEDEITVPPIAAVPILELGLFTNGGQNDMVPGNRDVTIGNAALQSPCAYKNLVEPVEKTSGLEFEVVWEIRF